MSKPKYPELFPPAFGNEEESMLQMGQEGFPLSDPQDFVSNFKEHIPAGIKTTSGFMQNGGLMYDGGASDDGWEERGSFYRGVNLERATPECATPSEAATYIQANEQIYVKMLQNYIQSGAEFGYQGVARAQRRVMDSYGNSRGSHDSIEARRPDWLAEFDQNNEAYSVFLRFLQTRSFITGAGYVDNEGTHFAQKVEGLTYLQRYGYLNSAFRNASQSDTGPRIEIRCNDINISPWAIQARIGGAALLFTMLQTPLVERLANETPLDLMETAQINNFRRFNKVTFDEEGTIKFTKDVASALDFQERVYEAMDEELADFVEVSDEYQRLIWELRYYCQDFRDVLHGRLPINALADRSDMAAKFDRMLDMQRKAKAMGIQRKLGDIASMATDLRYDNITVRLDNNGRAQTTYGYAYKLRDKGHFRLTPKAAEVEHAIYYPPATTRASTRGMLIRDEKIQSCDWSSVKYYGDNAPHLGLNEVVLREKPTPDHMSGKSLS